MDGITQTRLIMHPLQSSYFLHSALSYDLMKTGLPFAPDTSIRNEN